MRPPRLTARQCVGYSGLAVVLLLSAAVLVWRGDILRAWLDPEVPFQTYEPPPAPDYADPAAWALRDVRTVGAGDAAVFFLHSTTHDGGRQWNGPIGDPRADAHLTRVVLPNHAGPFARAGAVSAPRYRQASLYTRLTLRDDARDARAFAYGDAAAAFDAWLARHPRGPLVLAGVEQGGELLDRLLRERAARDPALRARIAAVYLIDVLTPVAQAPIPVCGRPGQAGCLVAWSAVREGDLMAAERRLRRALVWDGRGRLTELAGRPAVCVNPISGSSAEGRTRRRDHRGATNATGLEWGARPALMAREVEAWCENGVLFHTQPPQESFRREGRWADRRKAQPYNLFYADIEADVEARLATWNAAHPSDAVGDVSNGASG